MTDKEKLHRRINTRMRRLTERAERLHDLVDAGKIGGEPDREWLQSQVSGNGIDICCGDFLLDRATGVDSAMVLGRDVNTSGDSLAEFESNSLDYVASNYIEAFAEVLKTFGEWYRVLKPEGTLVLIARNADMDSTNKGPLRNLNRKSVFTKVTISQYLYRAGFKDVTVDTSYKQSMRVKATK